MKVVVPLPTGMPDEYQALRDEGHEVVLGRSSPEELYRSPVGEGELIELIRDADGVILSAMDGRLMDEAPNLHTIVVAAIGHERIDKDAATERDILVCNSPSPENFIGVAEATVGVMISLSKRFKRKEARLRGGEWGMRIDRGFLLSGKTVGIIGLGRVGSNLAKRLAGWDVNLLAYDPYVPAGTAMGLDVTMVDLPTLLAESDFVTLHVVLTPETTGMIDEAELRQMKPNAYLINTSRGGAVVSEAVVKAISENWIEGAALDVFPEEPLPEDSALRDLDPDRVMLTPHNLAGSDASRAGNLRLAVEGMVTALRGMVPVTNVNPEVLPRWTERIGPLVK